MLERAVTLGVQGSQSKAHGERGIARYLVAQSVALAKVAPRAIEAFDLDPELPDPPAVESFRTLGSVRRGEPPGADLPRLYHVMSPFEGHPRLERIWPRWAQVRGVKLAVTLYDLIPLRFPQIYLSSPLSANFYRGRLNMIRHADAVLAISEQTGRDAVDLLGVHPGRVHVVLAGSSDFFRERRPDDPSELGERFSRLRPGFILYTAGIDWRKNLEGLMAAYARLPPAVRREHQLVITCKVMPDARLALERHAEHLGIAADFVLTGWVPDEILRELYWSCGLFVFPSLFEGFGLPLIEALRCGAPVVASDRSSMPEIVTDPRDRFDPESPDDTARALEQALGDPDLRARQQASFRADDFTWERVAEKTLAAYEACLAVERRRATPPPRRPRLALFSPMPPQASGVADYSVRLARGLGRHCDVDVIVEGPTQRYAPPGSPRVRLLSHVGFEWNQGRQPYDRILYCMGNSQFHTYMWPFMERHRGDVLCHDVRLAGFFGSLGTETGDDLLLGRLVRQRYPQLLSPEERDPDQRIDSWELVERPIYLVSELQRRAHRLFVHSECARRIAEADGAQHVQVVPFGFPEVRPAPLFSGSPVIASFGIVNPVKESDLLVEAWPALLRRVPKAKLVLAGHASDEFRAKLEERVERLGLERNVELTGRLSDSDYRARLETTTLAVQLRRTTNGESSAALADCLSAGLPTLVTDIGSFAELPPEVVARVPAGVSPKELAASLASLLAEQGRRESLRATALAYASAHGFDQVADALWRHWTAAGDGTAVVEARVGSAGACA
jgi:glycosyltransferase involved in cell wall biosynthesis